MSWQDSDSIWCFDCGVELFAEDVQEQVRNNGTFSGKCNACLDRYGEE